MGTQDQSIPIRGSYWVIPGCFRAGEYPGSSIEAETRGKLRWLLEQRIDIIIDLTKDGEAGLPVYSQIFYEEAAKLSRQVSYKRFPLQDFGKPPRQKVVEILNVLDMSLSQGKCIYLHCLGGKGRTGTVVGCYLVRHGMTGKAALDKIHELRMDIPGQEELSPETEGQKRMVLEWKMGM